MNIIVHTDGGARGNPGPAAVGIFLEYSGVRDISTIEFPQKWDVFEKKHSGDRLTISLGKRIGETTNNVAEYTAVLLALESLTHVKKISGEEVSGVRFILDSELVVRQLNGIYKVKDSKLRELLLKVRTAEQIGEWRPEYLTVRREQNKDADSLVNQSLDLLSSSRV